MNGAHFHLIVNHFPIIIPIIGLLIMAGGFIFKSEVVKRTAYFVFIFGALSAVVAFFSGEGAEETLEGMQGISHKMIHAHEEMAAIFAILLYILGALSILGLWFNLKKKAYSNSIAIIAMVLSLVILFYGKQTGTTGGEIRHTEIRSGNIESPGVFGENDHSEEEDDD